MIFWHDVDVKFAYPNNNYGGYLMNANKEFILNAAATQGINVAILPLPQIAMFVGCVLLEIMVRPLPEALSRCFEKMTVRIGVGPGSGLVL